MKSLEFPDGDEEDEAKEGKAPRKPATDLDSAVEQLYLEIFFGPHQVSLHFSTKSYLDSKMFYFSFQKLLNETYNY